MPSCFAQIPTRSCLPLAWLTTGLAVWMAIAWFISTASAQPLPDALAGYRAATAAAGSGHHEENGQLLFVQNKGQWPESVRFAAEVSGGRVFIESSGFTWNFLDHSALQHHDQNPSSPLPRPSKGHAFRTTFIGANSAPQALGEDTRPFHHNYFNDPDPARWARGAAVHGSARLLALYPGVDLRVYAQGSTFKYDLELDAGVDPSVIKIRHEGLDQVAVVQGNLELTTSVNKLVEVAPYAYQLQNGSQLSVRCEYRLEGGELSYHFPDGYNPELPLVIDPPTLIFGSYSGSVSDNWGYTATYDDDGALYGGGISFGANYPITLGAYQSTWSGGIGSWPCDISISKFSSDGSTLEYSTFLGGSGNDIPHSMVCTPSGELLLYGTTGSANFPTTAGCHDNTFGGGTAVTVTSVIAFPSGTDMFVSKLDATGGVLLGSTYLGGSGNDGLNLSSATGYNYGDHARGEIIVDRNGNPFIASTTLSTNFPVTAGAYQTTPGGNQDGVIVKLNSNLTGLLFSTYIGGSAVDAAYSMKIGGLNMLIVCGGTTSTDFPTTAGAYQTSYQGGSADGWVARMTTNGTTLVSSTYVGTPAYDQVFMVETDADFKVYITGQTIGTFPVSAGVYSNPGSAQFVARMDIGLTLFEYSTVFGSGTNRVNIRPTAFLVDKCKNVYISGWGGLTNSSFNSNVLNTFGLPVTADATQSSTDGSDFYFIVFAREATSLLYATYFGGGTSREHVDGGTSRFDRNGIIYQAVCAGCGGHDDFPTTPGVWSNVNNSSNCNLGVIKYRFDFEEIEAAATVFPDSIGCVNFPVQFGNQSQNAVHYFWDFDDGTTSTAFEPSHLYTDTGVYNVMFVAIDSSKCIIADTVYLTIRALVPIDTTYDDVALCLGETVFLEGAWQSTAGVYTDTYLSRYGCDSTVITTVELRQTFFDTAYAYACTGDSVLFFGNWYASSGNYTQTFGTVGGCDSSFTLNLVVDTVVLRLETLRICDGDSALLGGAWQSTAGTYTDTILNVGGCDTILIRTLVLERFDITEDVDLCLGDSVFAGGSWQNGAGTFVDSLVSALGCDSIVTTVVTLRLPDVVADSLQICSGDSVLLGGGWQNLAGAYVDTLVNRFGCDSVVTTSLTLLPVFYTYDTLQVCTGDSALLITGAGGGTFIWTGTSANGCDSLVEYFVIPLPNAFGADTVVLCAGDSVLLDNWVSSPGSYPLTLPAANGCDSIVAVQVLFLDTFVLIQPLEICSGDSALILGNWETTSGLYTDTLTAANGCDSVLGWQLTVRPLYLVNVALDLCAGDSVFVGGAWQTLPGVYTDSLTSVYGCDSIRIYTVDTLPNYRVRVDVGLCPGDSVWLGGNWYTAPGSWIDTLASSLGCDSVVFGDVFLFDQFLQNRNLALCVGDSVFLQGAWQTGTGIYTDTLPTVHGCDSVIRTTVSLLPAAGSVLNRYLCAGDSTWFDGTWLSATGVYTQVFPAANGCDSVVTLNLQAEPSIFVPRSEALCSGDSVFAGGAWQQSAGVFVDSFTAVLGCDSVVQTTLTINLPVYDTLALSICQGDSAFLAGAWRSLPGMYTEFGLTTGGCDSLVSYALSLRPLSLFNQILEICAGDSAFVGGAWQQAAGAYSDTLVNASGCDSVVTTVLDVLPAYAIDRTEFICFGDSVFAAGAWQTTSGIYVETGVTAAGCDSVVRTMVTVLPVSASVRNVVLCNGDSLFVGGTWVTGAGTYLDNLTTVAGCDSVVQVNLSILPVSVRNVPVLLCGGDSAFLAGQWVHSAGVYPLVLTGANGCDSTINYFVSTGNPVTVTRDVSICVGDAFFVAGAFQTTAGLYADTLLSTAGCDSIVLTNLLVQPNVLMNLTTEICQGDSVFAGGGWQTTTGFYLDVLASATGCDSIIVQFVQVIPPINRLRNRRICYGGSIFLAGAWQTTAGVYVDTYTAASGCDSNIVTTLAVDPEIAVDVLAELCPGQFIIIGGLPVSTPGVYTQVFPSASGCDSTVTFTLQMRPVITDTVSAAICAGDSIFAAGSWQYTSGNYPDWYSTPDGCDSLVITALLVSDTLVHDFTAALCPGDSVFVGGMWVTAPGVYDQVLSTAAGCDSVVRYTVSLGVASVVFANVQQCEGSAYFAAGAWQTTAGVYTDTLLSALGCDSVVITDLQFRPAYLDSILVQTCFGDSVFAGGGWQTSAGTYTDFLTSAAGCDSTIVTVLAFGPLALSYDTVVICLGDSAFLAGGWQTAAGVYTDTLSGSGTCDTLLATTLITQFIATPVTLLLCEGDSLFAGGTWQSAGGLFADTFSSSLGCDSVVFTTILLSPRESYYVERALCLGDSAFLAGAWQTTPGLYVDTFANALGCDSIMQTDVTFIPYYYTFDTLYICDGDPIPGVPLTGGGGPSLFDGAVTFVDTLVASGGCDSIVEYTVISNPPSSAFVAIQLCAGDSLLIAGQWVVAAGTYIDTLLNAGGCDSVLTVQLSFVDTFQVYRNVHLCFGDSAEVAAGVWATTSGLYADTLLSGSGCDSITYTTLTVHPPTLQDLALTFCSGDSVFVPLSGGGQWVNAPGMYLDTLSSVFGCDSVLRFVVDSLPLARTYVQVNLCVGDSVWLAGAWRNAAGTYTQILTSASGCDSLLISSVRMRAVHLTGLNLTVCTGDSVFAAGAWQTDPGIYRDTLSSQFGCDSILQTTLSVLPAAGASLSAALCLGDSALFNGQWYTASGQYTAVLTAANGCDSTVLFDLSVETPYAGAVEVDLCQGDSLYAGGAWQSAAGVFVDSLLGVGGCDSVTTITVLVRPTYDLMDTIQVCAGDSVFLAGAWRNLPGTYSEFGTTRYGCDSIRNTFLRVIPAVSSLTIVEICATDSVFAGGSWQHSNGIYTDTLLSASGCDSLARLQLLVLPQVRDSLVVSICEGTAYFVGGAWQTLPGFYTEQSLGPDGCPQFRVTELQVNPLHDTVLLFTLCAGDSLFAAGAWQNSSGSYQEVLNNRYGCDSTITYVIDVLPLNARTQFTLLCEGDSLFAAGAYQTSAGTFVDLFSAANGCDSVVTIELLFAPSYFQNTDLRFCEGDRYIAGSDTFNTSGVYQQVYTTASGCDSIFQYTVDVVPLLRTETNLVVCEGDSAQFEGQWYAEAGVFVDTLSGAGECPELRILTVEVRPGAVLFAPDTVICEGDQVQLIATGVSTYFWSPAQGLSCTDCADPWVTVSSTTLFTVTTTDACVRNPVEESLVEVMARPTVDAGLDQAVAPGQPVTLAGDGLGNGPLLYWWEVDGQRVCTDCPEWTLVPEEGAVYTVWVEDGLGCRASDPVLIQVDNSCIDGRFDPANAFSPNGDGRNDEFVIRYIGPQTVDRVRIYNRWGELLYETEDPEVHWNGVFRGKLLDPGVYVYYLEGLCEDNKTFLHVGNVTLVR
ncbi:MAG: T9SS type B sorting domain-containing protein [Bacteroidetes bacterium]|nr:T9SS type B sorting domain-containing protein [Bacteroidota bacterium]